MSVILEFEVEDDQFRLGRVLSSPSPVRVELERVVPSGDDVIPFLWVQGRDYEAFEETVLDSRHVEDLVAVDSVDDGRLYRVSWTDGEGDLVRGLSETDGTILEGYGDGTWEFRVRFDDHETLSQFYSFSTGNDIGIRVVRTYTPADRTESVRRFGLSSEQREALVLGLQRGHFDTPSESSSRELAAELGITQQAFSERVRRGTKRVLAEALRCPTADSG